GVTPVPLKVEAGPYLRVQGVGVTVDVLGQSLGGDFTIEQMTVAGAKKTRVSLKNGTLSLGGGIVSLTKGEGDFLLTPAGLAGQFKADIGLSLTGVTFAAAVSVKVNNTNAAVKQTFTNPDSTIDLPAGPYLRVELTGTLPNTGAKLSILEQTLEASFV